MDILTCQYSVYIVRWGNFSMDICYNEYSHMTATGKCEHPGHSLRLCDSSFLEGNIYNQELCFF